LFSLLCLEVSSLSCFSIVGGPQLMHNINFFLNLSFTEVDFDRNIFH